MAIILFYGPFNQRSRDTESLMLAFRKQGHQVLCLTQQEGYQINEFLQSQGIAAYANVIKGPRTGWWYYLQQLVFFIRFCRRHKVDVVYSHLEPANFVASIGQYFIPSRTFLCRHHIDEGQLYRFENDLYYRITYQLARRIIVVSNHAMRYMVEREKIPARKIIHINLAYDFNLYPQADPKCSHEIRQRNKSEILLLTMCRLTKFKRPEMSVKVLAHLVERGIDARLIILGKGEMEDDLLQLIKTAGLDSRVELPGYVNNIMDYLDAADFLIHPSVLDSSCVVIKEAGLAIKPVVVCEGVGDFDDYIVSGHNGWKVNKDRFVEEAAMVITQHCHNKPLLSKVGEELHQSVLRHFSVEYVEGLYNDLNRT